MDAALDATGAGNDTTGWIMCLVSGIACVIGSSIICVDVVVRLFPGQKSFRVQDSNVFLASSLSLSFGVMIFMSLYSMLPEAKSYLLKGGFEDQQAGFILMGCFIGGFIGIQVLSRFFHQLLPSHVVDCDHTHDDQDKDGHVHDHDHDHDHTYDHAHDHHGSRKTSSNVGPEDHSHHEDHRCSVTPNSAVMGNGHATESTPLLPSDAVRTASYKLPKIQEFASSDQVPQLSHGTMEERRPSIMQVQKRVMSFVKDTKANCDETGPCFGYSDPCGKECMKHLSSRSSRTSRVSNATRSTTGLHSLQVENLTVEEDDDGNETSPTIYRPRSRSRHSGHSHIHEEEDHHSLHEEDLEAQHHHHVPDQAFLAIGLQTSIAIALHKFPEGFITYATNHANPALGFNVFLALFVHNISEGFAMALPLYLALNSRFKAIAWSSLLGGLSQPLGAGIAAIWFKVAKHTNMTPDAVAYGCLFGITAGIMASVALQLFVESLSLNHNRNLSIVFAFLGMALLGISSAFTKH